MNELPGLRDRLTVRRSLLRPKRQRITLCFGACQVLLGLTIVAVSFAAFGLSTSNRVRNACPYWAGFSVLLTGGVGVIAWKQPSVLAVSFFTFLSAVCVILHLVATVLSGETGSLLKSFLVCTQHEMRYTCLCCESTYECGREVKQVAVEFEGVLDCNTVPTTLKELMYTICVVNVIACLLCFIATILGCANIVKRNTGRRFRFGRLGHGHEHIDPTTIGEVIDSVFTPPVPPPPYSPPEYGEISGDPVMVEASGFVEVGANAINPSELPPPYSTLDISPDSAFEHLTSEASPMDPIQIGANETSGLESCQSPITPSDHYCHIYVNPASMENFPQDSLNSGISVTPAMQQYTCITDRNSRKQSLTDSLPKKKIYPNGKYELEIRTVRHILASAPVQYRHSTHSDMENNNFHMLHNTAGDRASGKFSDISKSRDSTGSSVLSNQVIAEVNTIPCAIGETAIDNYVSSRESVLKDTKEPPQKGIECMGLCQATVELHNEHSPMKNTHIPVTVKTYNVNASGHPSSRRSFQSISAASLSSDSDSCEEYVLEEQCKSYPRTKKQRRREMHALRRRERRNSEKESVHLSVSCSSTSTQGSQSEKTSTTNSKRQRSSNSVGSLSSQGSKPHASLCSISSFKSVETPSPARLSICSVSSKSRTSVNSLSSTANSKEMLDFRQPQEENMEPSVVKPARPNSLEIKSVHNLPTPSERQGLLVAKKQTMMKELHPSEIKRRYITHDKSSKLSEAVSKPVVRRKTKTKSKVRPKSLADFKSFKDAKVLVAKFIEQSNGTVSPAVKSVLENIQAMIKSDERHMAEAIHSANVLGQYTQPVPEVQPPKPACTTIETQQEPKETIYKSTTSLGSRHWRSCSDITALSDHSDDNTGELLGQDLVKTLTICKETVL
ncbi:uncharacterized protein LOC144447664 [Glandiceps talaboti]